jgi:hypothetical protein
MDHAEVVERIELAAVEPDGLARLAAGDTPDAAAVAGHVAGCPACAGVLARTTRTAALAREAIRELPDPALRARTLEFVRTVGVDRTAAAAAPPPEVAAGAAVPPALAIPAAATIVPSAGDQIAPPAAHASSPTPSLVLPRGRLGSRAPWWAAAAMAAVVIAAVGGFALGGAAQPPGTTAGGVAAVQTTIHIAQQADAVRIDLAAAGGGPAHGTVLYSASSGELAMVASGLDAAPSGSSYACWVEQAGQRRRLGPLYLSGGSGDWAGPVSGLGDIGPGAVFGVSLVSDGAAADSAVLTGTR